MRSFLFPSRAREASPTAIANSGAYGGNGFDPIDGDYGYTQLGVGRREIPTYTLEKARAYAVAAFRTNPMARAVLDTFVQFGVGDSGLSIQCSDPDVLEVVQEWWDDPANRFDQIQQLLMRDWMLNGELIPEYLVGPDTGVVQFNPIDPSRVRWVELDRGNPLWPAKLHLLNGAGGDGQVLDIVNIDPTTGLRTGTVGFFPSWRATLQDRRGMPFLTTISDTLDAYDQVLNNLVDRTALTRWMAADVTMKGASQTQIDDFIKQRGGAGVPRAGTIEVHNENTEWKFQTADTGSFQDTNTLNSILTNVASGSGLAKPWLAESEGANRATSQSMAEPVRRRVGGIQNEFVSIMTEQARFVVDQAVRVGRLAGFVSTVSASGKKVMVPAARCVRITGPEVAAADAGVTASVMLNLATALEKAVNVNVLSRPAAALAMEKAWEQFSGQPFRADLKVSPSDDPTPAVLKPATEKEAAQLSLVI